MKDSHRLEKILAVDGGVDLSPQHMEDSGKATESLRHLKKKKKSVDS